MAGSDPRAGRAPLPDRGNVEAEEDPLVELARIVSEDGGFSAPKTEKPKMNRNEATQRSSYDDGLEAELLQELENSLGGRETPPPPPPRTTGARPAQSSARTPAPPPQRRASAEVEADPDDLLRSIEEQLGQFERRQSERLAATTPVFAPAPEPADEEEPEFQASNEAADEDAFSARVEAAPQPPPQPAWRSRVSRLRPLDDDEEEETPSAPPQAWDEPDTLPAPPRRSDYRFRGPAGTGWDRPASPASYDPAPSRDEPYHAEEPSARRIESIPGYDDEESDADLFAPTGKAGRAHDPFAEAEPVREFGASQSSDEAARRRKIAAAFPEFDEEPAGEQEDEEERAALNARLAQALELDFADPSYSKQWTNGAAGETEADEPKVAAAVASGASRRAAAARAQAAQRSRGARTALITIVGVVVVILIGGAAAFLLRSTESGPATPPPVISADAGPVKVTPPPKTETSSDSEAAGDAVYNRVAGNAPASTNEKVVDSSEEPREVARIVLPSPQSEGSDAVVKPVGGEAPASDNGTADTAPAASGSTSEIGPREVATFTVRPDGTIVANTPAEGAGTSTPEQPAAEQQTASAETAPAPAANAPAAPAASAAPAQPTAAETLSSAGQEVMAPRPAIEEPATVAAVAPAKPAHATTNSAAPVNLLSSANAPAVDPGQVVGDGYLVQVSSQRSMDQAQSAYSDLEEAVSVGARASQSGHPGSRSRDQGYLLPRSGRSVGVARQCDQGLRVA